MSYAAPFSLLSFHLPPGDDSAEERLTWPLAGSLVIHACVFIAFLSLRFASSFEQSSGSYEVTLVTLPEIASSPAASPANKSRPERNADKVPPPKAEAGEAPKVAPQKKAVNLPSPVPQEKPRVPERVTDSLVGALDSVVVPKPQAPALLQKVEPVPAPAPSPAPIRQAPAVELDVQPVQAPPQPPKLAPEPVTGNSEMPTPAPKVDLLAETLKQAVGTIVIPKKPKQASSRVTVTPDAKQNQDITEKDTTKAPRSSGITLPSRAPRPAVVTPPETPKKEMPRQTARKNSTVESLTQAIQSVRVPDLIRKSQMSQPVSEAVPLVREPSPTRPKAAEARNLPQKKFVSPQAPQLAEVTVERDPVPSQSTVPMTMSAPDTLGNQIAKLEVPDFDTQPGFQQTESGVQETLALQVAGPSPKENAYWMRVTAIIKAIWDKKVYRVKFQRKVVLGFRVLADGRLEKKKGIVVVRPSGNERFDSFAKDAVDEASLPPFPDNMPKPFYDVQYTFTGLPNR